MSAPKSKPTPATPARDFDDRGMRSKAVPFPGARECFRCGPRETATNKIGVMEGIELRWAECDGCGIWLMDKPNRLRMAEANQRAFDRASAAGLWPAPKLVEALAAGGASKHQPGAVAGAVGSHAA